MFDSFSKGISVARIDAYRSTGSNDLEVLTNCMWNTALSEAFYPSLQYLEVSLRNSMHNALTFTNRNPRWFKTAIMCARCAEDVQKAEKELVKDGKDHNDPNRMVAELGFGFWTRLFNKHYQQPLWNNKGFLMNAFPNATPQQRFRPTFSSRIDEIRRFRNRLFHHERILGYNLTKLHSEIIETIGWVSKDVQVAAQTIDRFPVVNNRDYQEKLRGDLAKYFEA